MGSPASTLKKDEPSRPRGACMMCLFVQEFCLENNLSARSSPTIFLKCHQDFLVARYPPFSFVFFISNLFLLYGRFFLDLLCLSERVHEESGFPFHTPFFCWEESTSIYRKDSGSDSYKVVFQIFLGFIYS